MVVQILYSLQTKIVKQIEEKERKERKEIKNTSLLHLICSNCGI